MQALHIIPSSHYDTVHLRLSGPAPKDENNFNPVYTVSERMYGAVESVIGVIREVNSRRHEFRFSGDLLAGLTGTGFQNRLDLHDFEAENWGDIGAYNMPALMADKPPTSLIYTTKFRVWDVRAAEKHAAPSLLHGKAYRYADPMKNVQLDPLVSHGVLKSKEGRTT
jgi:hypothetical protein